jgi:hypothetical protein
VLDRSTIHGRSDASMKNRKRGSLLPEIYVTASVFIGCSPKMSDEKNATDFEPLTGRTI